MRRYLELYPRWVNIMTRGVCQEWQTFHGFHDWAVKNRLTDSRRLLRRDSSKPYSPANCIIIGEPPAEIEASAEPGTADTVIDQKSAFIPRQDICKGCTGTCQGLRKDCRVWQKEYKIRWDEIAEVLRQNLPE